MNAKHSKLNLTESRKHYSAKDYQFLHKHCTFSSVRILTIQKNVDTNVNLKQCSLF